ncbi:MAG: DUF4173 domain-containing protein [Planctomycetota bacterium]
MSYTGWALRRRGSFLLAVVVGMVWLADWLFYGQTIGWSAGIFSLALLLALTLRGGRYFREKPGRIVAATTLGMVVAMMIHPGPLAVTLGLLGLVTLAVIDRGGWTSSVAEWAWRWARFVGLGLSQAIRDVRTQNRWLRKHPQDTRGVAGFATHNLHVWLIPVLLSTMFVGLFAIANPVVQHRLSDAIENLFARLGDLGSWLVPARMGFWLATAVAVWALLRVRLKPKAGSEKPRRPRTWRFAWEPPREGEVVTGPTFTPQDATALTVRCLILFNVVFAVQTSLDVFYLYGGATLPDGMTYAEYAHRGAYPLVVTALLAGLFVLIAFHPRGAAQRSTAARRLVGLWIAQNIVLMVSSVWRLNLYVEVYSLTRWRVAAALWMALVGVGFGWLIWRIVADRDNRWLLQRVTLTGLTLLYVVCFVNLDGAIARYNVAHCAEMGGEGHTLDVAYLERLGPAALPALNQYIQATHDLRAVHPTPENADAWTSAQESHRVVRRLENQLDGRLENWRGWTWRRSQIARELVATR